MESIPEPYRGNNEQLSTVIVVCFAYVTIKDRLPTILVKAMDTFRRNASCVIKHRLINASNEEQTKMEDECKLIVAKFSKLRYQMMTNKELEMFSGSFSDVQQWNNAFVALRDKQGNVTWFDSPWLFVECFMYRSFTHFFQSSLYFRCFDPFEEQKNDALISSLNTAKCMAEHLCRQRSESRDFNQLRNDFITFLALCLWGNHCDLSLSSGNKCVQDDSYVKDLHSFNSYILCNDSQALFDFVFKLKSLSKVVTIDIVVDNAGFELFSDLCFVEMLYLTEILNADSSLIRFHVKKMPWFVSDALKKDFHWLLDYLSNCENSTVLQELGNKWKSLLKDNSWIIIEEDYWTLPNDYSDMQRVDAKLYSKLEEADLIIFKGDLNYRKLTGDLMWDHRTPFITALRGFLPSPLCSLRTIKADVVVGLESESVYCDLPSNWRTTGQYALVQFASV
ncbi:protein-glutamate O-methyltransferase-like isoform X1 [Leptotrombidium deliense]|uniref:Sugar phosphate phosphatase n=1 Tax=Leptotrombidium deliense TaxID=299467 RepID=A0A443SDI0_9ACAR|nr:protein-glutamate O-methyltransferase-like isoform X1 [Leptotrombidium deliense]